MASKTPTVVLVPGAWSVPAMYQKLVAALEAKLFTVHVPALPSNNGARPPSASHADDVAAVRAVVKSLVDEGSDVFMLMHSYGGAVGTSAAEGLSRKHRQAKSLPGGVVHLLYLSAYLLAKGQSVWKIVQMAGLEGEVKPHVIVNEDGTWIPKNAVAALCHDLDPADQDEQNGLVTVHNMACVYGEAVCEAWRDVPSTYVRTTEDRCVKLPCQDICVANARDAGVPLQVVAFDCAHAAYVKYPGQLTELVVKASGST
ncbi:alpha/beta-hydrolase [Annulohypoxylon bovei var. microspora]|nr:alpha/beta-hydrolase [Annulohypoxylon bovei var. microspora]